MPNLTMLRHVSRLSRMLEDAPRVSAGRLLLVTGSYVVAGKVGLLFPIGQDNVTLVWPPSGIALAATVLLGYRVWPALVAGAFIVNATTAAPAIVAAAAAVGNPAEAMVGAFLLRRAVEFRPELDRPIDVVGLVGLAAGLATVISATIGVSSLLVSDLVNSRNAASVWFYWWLGDVGGILIIAPLLLTWARRPPSRPVARRLAEGVGLAVAVAAASVVGFEAFPRWTGSDLPLGFAVTPFLVYAGFRFGQRGATAATLIAVLIALVVTVGEVGRVVQGTAVELLYLSVFMTFTSVTTMLLTALLAQRTSADQALRQSHRLIEAVIEGTSDAIFVKDRQGRYLMINTAGAAVFGRLAAEVVGRTDEELLPRKTARRLRANDEAALATGSLTLEERLGPKGAAATFLTRRHLYRGANGEPIGIVGIARDISERVRLEAELGQAQKMEAVGRLAGGVAHDFNNLLTVILGCTDLLRATVPKEDPMQGDLEQLRHAARRGADLTQQLLAFARRQVVEPRILSLASLTLHLDGLIRRLIGEHIDLVTRAAPGLWPVRADPAQLEQVVLNLAVNARDAMPNGGVLTIETKNLSVDPGWATHQLGVPAGDFVALSVSDTGAGIARAAQDHLFEPYYTTKEPGKGTGLGLASCYGIVTSAGGQITADSSPGRGTTFRVYLPRAVGELMHDEPSIEGGLPIGSETILLAEDEVLVRRVAARVLRDSGYRVLEASNGVAALELAASWRDPIDLLITDLMMPRMGGRDLAAQLHEVRPSVRTLFISGYSEDVVRGGSGDFGMAFLGKPFTPLVLTRRVREILDSPALVIA